MIKENFKREGHATVQMLKDLCVNDENNPLLKVASPIINLGLNKVDKTLDEKPDEVYLTLMQAKVYIDKLVTLYDSEP